MIALNELLANAPYWAFAAALAVGFYGSMRWLGTHFRESFRQDLTHWLNGLYESSWSVHFCRLFDRVFGEKPLSLKRFVRSSIASFIAVWLLYILFAQVLGVLGNRTHGNLDLFQVVLLGAVINLVPDYISLLETRWLLERFAKVRGFFAQALLLVADLLFSAAIIWFAIALFSLVRDGRVSSPVEIIALFNVYAVFFYSTFLTSLWAWVYCLSAWFIRLFSNLGLGKVLDIEKAPEKQIALAGSVVLFSGALLGSPLIKSTDDHGSSRFNDFVCSIDLNSCLHAARLSNDPQRVVHFMSIVCGNNLFSASCDYRLTRFFSDDWTGINTLLLKACDGGSVGGCVYLGFSYSTGRGVDADLDKANALYKQACDGDSMGGCVYLGISYATGHGVGADLDKAHDFYQQACDGGDMSGCNNLGFNYSTGSGVDADLDKAHALYQQACDGGDMRGCNNLGFSYATGRGVDADIDKANDFYKQACEGGEMLGCRNLGFSYQAGQGVDADIDKAHALYQRACDGGDSLSCDRL